MRPMSKIPNSSYGAFNAPSSKMTGKSKHAISIYKSGYSVIDSGISDADLLDLEKSLEEVHQAYLQKYGIKNLETRGEKDIVRMPFAHSKSLLELVFNKNLITLVDDLIEGTFILNQQNAVFNPANASSYTQASWHRDLPYQHFVTSKPIAISCLFCIDNFTLDNGATYVLPGSHKEEWLPSKSEIRKRSLQLEAQRGQFIVFDSMCFHAGGINLSNSIRRGINHVFTIPYIKQQISFPKEIEKKLSDFEKQVLGYKNLVPDSIDAFLNSKESS